jgi:hypothetical protein
MEQDMAKHEGIDLELVAPSVHRLMNEQMHAAILKSIMEAALTVGWRFEYTKEAHELSSFASLHIAEAIYPAYVKFTRPRLHLTDPESINRWAREAIEDGWAANWLDHTLQSLRKLGIRPIPYTV